MTSFRMYSVVTLLLLLIVQIQASTFRLSDEHLTNEFASLRSDFLLKRRQVTPLAPGATPQNPVPLQLIAPPDDRKPPNALDQEELDNSLIEIMTKLDANLEGITNFGSDISDIQDGAARVIRLIPQVNAIRQSVSAAAPSQNLDQLNSASQFAVEAGERLAQSMREILKNPADANIIRKEYRHIRECFRIMTGAFAEIASIAIPQVITGTNTVQEAVAGGNPVDVIRQTTSTLSEKGHFSTKALRESIAEKKNNKITTKAERPKSGEAQSKNKSDLKEAANKKQIDLKQKPERPIAEEGSGKIKSVTKDSFTQRKNMALKEKAAQPTFEEELKNPKALGEAPKNSPAESQVKQHIEPPTLKGRLKQSDAMKPVSKA
ncbi:hypothetical protein PGT21_029979 [Puccinia graminis f. sp. tritici]|uniref:Uncharacterized protein n=1 Tax=Puccinia graminis f. sp. tritici TaxID=56615 RepID=A0A5B0P6Z0_PUCGR|nr:hypothetical protein PGT21_029979 [Puccinia graminis f. sp. tritici]KAA1108017.1 hypothetical protein PGTUg99_023859 [Puccinia graminis f. sp. tritici]